MLRKVNVKDVPREPKEKKIVKDLEVGDSVWVWREQLAKGWFGGLYLWKRADIERFAEGRTLGDAYLKVTKTEKGLVVQGIAPHEVHFFLGLFWCFEPIVEWVDPTIAKRVAETPSIHDIWGTDAWVEGS